MQNWDDLRYFLAINRQGSLNAAAQQLGVDQSTVFRRLRALEKYLDAQVFDRRQHGKYELTAAGESLVEYAGQMEEATFNIERDVIGRDLQFSGTIRVTTAEDIAVLLLPIHLAAFRRAFPSISIEVLTANRYFSLGRGEADVAIRPGFSSDESRVIPRKICPTAMALFASPGYLAEFGAPRQTADLASHRLLGWRADLAADGYADFLDQLNGDATRYGSNSLMTHRAMAEQGLGIAFLPDFVGKLSSKLVPVLPQNSYQSGYIWILHHDDLRHAARVRAFVDFMAAAAHEFSVELRALEDRVLAQGRCHEVDEGTHARGVAQIVMMQYPDVS